MHFRLHIVVSIPFPVSLYNPNIIVVSIGDKLLPQDVWYLLRSLALSTKLDKFGQIILVKPKPEHGMPILSCGSQPFSVFFAGVVIGGGRGGVGLLKSRAKVTGELKCDYPTGPKMVG